MLFCLHELRELTFLPILVRTKLRIKISPIPDRILKLFQFQKLISHHVYMRQHNLKSFSLIAFCKYTPISSIIFSLIFIPVIADKILKKIGEGQSKFLFLIYDLIALVWPWISLQFYSSPGTFGQVLECWDREQKGFVAIKIIRSIKKYREAAMVEVDVLQLLGRYDRGGSRYVLSMLYIMALLHI